MQRVVHPVDCACLVSILLAIYYDDSCCNNKYKVCLAKSVAAELVDESNRRSAME